MSLLNRISHARISRRDFLKGSAAATASLAALGLAGCQANEVVKDTSQAGTAEQKAARSVANAVLVAENGTEHPEPTNREAEGTWVSAACWQACNGRCINKVMLIDGIVVRQKTDDTHEDSLEYPQQRSCLKGRSRQKQCFSADRLKYPLKRKHWEPLTGGQKELRGKDEWERITWDEAFQYIADEYKHCLDTYGNDAILVPGLVSQFRGSLENFLGGHPSVADSGSLGSYYGGITGLVGIPAAFGDGNDRLDLKNADYIVMEGANPAWTTLGTGLYTLVEAKKSGTKFVFVDPFFNAAAQTLDAKWIPIRPGTDMAFLLGVAYEMIQADVVDYDFLNKYTVGFDADHMPEDATTDENFRGYLMGEYDGVVKDATWASKICGASVEDIQYLAQVLGKDNKTRFMHGTSIGRVNGGENIPQLFETVGFMGGHAGKPGHAVECNRDGEVSCGNYGPLLVTAGGNGLPYFPNLNSHIIPGPQAWDAVLNGKYTYIGDPYLSGFANGEEREIDIHILACDIEGNYILNGPNTNKAIQAFRKVDFVVSRGHYMNASCKYADIVLPITTKWEWEGGFPDNHREFLGVFTKVIDPLYESKTDKEIDRGILEAMGYDPNDMYPISEKAQFFNQILGCQVINEAGDAMETLVTVTQDDIDAWGVQEEMEAAGLICAPQEGRIELNTFLSNGGYQVPRKEGDNYGYLGYGAFVEDPEANPLSSKSGKLEIYCQAKADAINDIPTSDLEVKPYPNYFVPITGYEQTFEDANIENGNPSEYPYVMYNPHYIARAITAFDNNEWLRETYADPMFISKKDAEEKRIVTGDTVLVYNQYGRILRRASVLPNMMPGVVGIPHGATIDMDEENEVDRGGSTSVLIGAPAYGMNVTGYNNNNCNFEKYDGEPLPLRHEIPQIIFED